MGASRGLTQTRLADAVGISHAYLAQIEASKRVGEVRLRRRVGQQLRVQIEDLLPEQT
jgi:transcriptional regulator with XRE-family HTH domain